MPQETRFLPPFIKRPYGSSHVYEDANGRPVISVTSVLSQGYPKPALVPWAASVTADYVMDHWNKLARLPISKRYEAIKSARFNASRAATIRGTAIHQAAEAIGKGGQDIGPLIQVPADSTDQIEAYRAFLKDWNVEPIAVERVVGHTRHGYAGTFDLLALVGGEPYLIDIKTNKSGVFPETALQLSAYRWADWSEHQGIIERLGEVKTAVVWLKLDGGPGSSGYDLVPVDAGKDAFRTFLAALQLATWNKTAESAIGEPLASPATAEMIA